MRGSAARWSVAVLLLAVPLAAQEGPPGATGAPAAAEAEPAAPGRSAAAPRNADYTIEARLDPAAGRIEGTLRLAWTNVRERPAGELPFHLYWNAWRNNRSSWMLEERLDEEWAGSDGLEPEDWGWMTVESVRWLGDRGAPAIDLTAAARHAAPDDGNRHDRTLLTVPAPRPVEPGETVELELAWRAAVPRTFARTGRRGDFFFVAHWFPKLAVFEEEGWSRHQFHAATEFYSDYGRYDVSLTLPERFVVGATGRRVERREGTDGEVTWRFVQENVHGFAWTASPDFRVVEERFEAEGLPPVELLLLLQPEHAGQAERHLAATRAALELYGRWYGPYPYDHLTIVDPAWGSGAGGMEYPTLFTAGTRLFNPPGGGSPELVTIHEAGHQFWYGVVGNDEMEHAWLDEGLNTYSTWRVYREAFGDRVWSKRYFRPPGTDLRGFFPLLFPAARIDAATGGRLDRFRPAATWDPQARETWRYFPPTAARTSYDKTALWLATLERHLGWPIVRDTLATFYRRWSFRHPEPDDLLGVAEEVAGQELDWFFDQVYAGTQTFDYAVTRATSEPFATEGWVEEGGELVYLPPARGDGTAPRYRSEVVVRRLGDGVFPVQVVLAFEDGSRLERSWDGRDGWLLVTEERPARLAWAAVDPDRVLLLDLDPTNNSRLVEPRATFPALKWAARWLVWLQERLRVFTFFA